MRIAVIGATGWLGGAIADPATDDAGDSAIASGDLAVAMLDELEQPQFRRRRFTAAYGS